MPGVHCTGRLLSGATLWDIKWSVNKKNTGIYNNVACFCIDVQLCMSALNMILNCTKCHLLICCYRGSYEKQEREVTRTLWTLHVNIDPVRMSPPKKLLDTFRNLSPSSWCHSAQVHRGVGWGLGSLRSRNKGGAPVSSGSISAHVGKKAKPESGSIFRSLSSN